jgi:hypothetical protein
MGEFAWLAECIQLAQAIKGGDGPECSDTTREVIRGDRGGETGDEQSFCYELDISLGGRLGHDCGE